MLLLLIDVGGTFDIYIHIYNYEQIFPFVIRKRSYVSPCPKTISFRMITEELLLVFQELGVAVAHMVQLGH